MPAGSNYRPRASTNSDEIDRCYQAGANSYICKPIHLDEILSTAAWFVAYWPITM